MFTQSVAAFVLLATLQGGPSDKDGFVLKNFVHFERIYIPALVYTKVGDLPESRKAIGALRREWNDFRRRNSGWLRNDPDGVAGFSSVDGKILKAEETIAYGRSLREAHEALEGIAATLLEIRRRLGMEYYPDLLLDFRGPVEKMAQRVEGKESGSLSPEDLDFIRQNLEAARANWKRVEETKFDAQLYQFDTAAANSLDKGIADVSSVLKSLDAALRGGDQAKVIAGVRALQPSLAHLYRLFGGFKG